MQSKEAILKLQKEQRQGKLSAIYWETTIFAAMEQYASQFQSPQSKDVEAKEAIEFAEWIDTLGSVEMERISEQLGFYPNKKDLYKLFFGHGKEATPVKGDEKYESPYPSEITYKSDKNFIVRLKALIDKTMKESGYSRRGG